MIETLVHGYPSESTQRELSNEHQHDRVKVFFVHPCTLDTNSLSIGRDKDYKDYNLSLVVIEPFASDIV